MKQIFRYLRRLGHAETTLRFIRDRQEYVECRDNADVCDIFDKAIDQITAIKNMLIDGAIREYKETWMIEYANDKVIYELLEELVHELDIRKD